ncbi:MAG TPA: hypothetical protein VLH86_03275 [Patescibacteria group bacterium]|nr:hypothetical protein [Patescibacteria group bacterium]
MVKTREEWQQLCRHKIDLVKRLIAQKEWEVAGEYMGYALECALKAAACKTLDIDSYPPIKIWRDAARQPNEISGFKTHEFDALIVLGGLSKRFSADFELNQFTSSYTGDWENRRYEGDLSTVYDEKTVIELSKLLYDSDESIINKFDKEGLW